MMDDRTFAETRAARLCSWILFAAVSVYSAWAFLRIYTTKDPIIHLTDDLKAGPPLVFVVVTHPAFLWSIPLAVLVGFVKEIRMRDKTRTMIWNGIHLILILLVYGVYEAGLMQPLLDLMDSLSGGKG